MPRGDIRNWTKALAGRCNWSWLNDAFSGTAISPSDLDFVVERRGSFLIGEIKPGRNAMSQGQNILLNELAKVPKMTVFYLVGNIEEHEITPIEMLIFGENYWRPTSRAEFSEFCRCWYVRANNA